MERMPLIGYPPSVGKLRQEQIANQSTWDQVPEGKAITSSMHLIHMVPFNDSTETRVNPIDPGDGFYIKTPSSRAPVIPAGRMRY